MGIKKDFLKTAIDVIMKANPSYDKELVEKVITRKMKECITNPSIKLENEIKRRYENTTLSALCDWIDKEKPIISGNATFYVQPEVLESPTATMLRDKKKQRGKIKKEMFVALSNGDMDTYRSLDLTQSNDKVIMNAEYGGSGAPTAAFYNKYTPSATTLMAQSIITIIAAFFEGYEGDNQKFYHINEFFDWALCVMKKKELPKWVAIPSHDEVLFRIKSHFAMYNIEDDEILSKFIQSCNGSELAYLYYVNNMKEFIRRNDKPKSLMYKILSKLPLYEAHLEVPAAYKDKFTKIDEYNSWVAQEMFMNPYSPPDIIKKELDELSEIINQFCYVDYITPDSIVKLNKHIRTAVLLVDTDSNVINANLFVEFILDEIFPNETFGRKKLYNEIICVNVLTRLFDKCIQKMLDLYGRCHNINEEGRKELSMKNEFMFRRLLLMNEKKRYASSIVLREGNIMIPFKTDIKGVDFIKAGVSDEVSDRFTKMLKDHILFSDELELRELMKALNEFKNEIYNDLRVGGVRYLKPQTYKPEEAYKKKSDGSTGVWQLPVFRASTVWNELYPSNKIYSLDRVRILKLIVTDQSDLDVIKDKYPDEYNLAVTKIFNSNNPKLVSSGLKVIGIPSNVSKVPDWLIPLIDYDNIISDVLNSFGSITKALKVEGINIKTPNGTARIISNLISI